MKKFRFVINGNNYEVEVLGFEENIARLEVNGTSYNVEVQKDLKMTKTPVLVRAEVPQPTRKESKIPRVVTRTTNQAITAEKDGIVRSVKVKPGENVAQNDVLVEIE